MRRAFVFAPSMAAAVAAAAILAGVITAAAGQRTLAQAQASGWDCEPLVLIGGHFHCSPPGKPGVLQIIDGTATSPSIVHQVFRQNGAFAGTETLIRADLFARQPCPTDGWLPVPPWQSPPAHWACHHFDFTP